MNVARNNAASMRAGATLLEAMHTHSIAASWRLNDVHLFVVVIVHLVLWNTNPACLANHTQVIFATENGGLRTAAALEWERKEAERAIDFQHFRVSLWLLHSHVESMIRCQTASTQEAEFFLGSGNLLVANEILEIGFRNAAKALL